MMLRNHCLPLTRIRTCKQWHQLLKMTFEGQLVKLQETIDMNT